MTHRTCTWTTHPNDPHYNRSNRYPRGQQDSWRLPLKFKNSMAPSWTATRVWIDHFLQTTGASLLHRPSDFDNKTFIFTSLFPGDSLVCGIALIDIVISYVCIFYSWKQPESCTYRVYIGLLYILVSSLRSWQLKGLDRYTVEKLRK